MGGAAEQADEADEAFAGAGQTVAPAHARAAVVRRGHRFAAYPPCSADMKRVRRILRESGAGALAAMLEESYALLLDALGEPAVAELRQGWREFDREVHDQPNTVGRCGFLTLVDGEVAGFASWDPRGWPDVGRVGHNCIRPAYQGHAHGRSQIEEILCRFRDGGFAVAEARTGAEDFFEPARRMYVRCGFQLVGRAPGKLDAAYDTLVYRVELRAGCRTSG